MAGTGKAHLRDGGARLTVKDLVVEFRTKGDQRVQAVSGVSFDVLPGETLSIVGESGCGKSSVARAVMHLPAPTDGAVQLNALDLGSLDKKALRRSRVAMQIVFQDPVASLNPRRKVKDLVQEGASIWGRGTAKSRDRDAREVLDAVGLDPDVVWNRRPHELSGGQCQRVSIARALVMEPDLLICDEILSSLDVSIQAQMLNLLRETKAQRQLSMLFIAHDLAVVKNISDRILVMYLGKVCEVLDVEALDRPATHHPYTQLLLESVPTVGSSRVVPSKAPAGQDLPSPLNPPSGCRFRTRCPLATPRCAVEEPRLERKSDDQFIACHEVA
ncbi:dipeptide ABC transporter ATP-binding protein [Acrocarpospora macrocephala]|uniref:Peptide ABC transporter ATP-binding protein n=1 Tax=Acrocarpospora macrocephala TaxID=150177 RepID=A0A5M3WJ93_9ACTN|nr:ABC transporter ATP-binding protein [Acrocarpospora macrocephala]GES09014.1 peptide ABC transporter ATP-binding protein [Acrocarpospora macrocephala]